MDEFFNQAPPPPPREPICILSLPGVAVACLHGWLPGGCAGSDCFRLLPIASDCFRPLRSWQGDKELATGLPTSPGFDRKTTSVHGSQIAFIDFIVMPLVSPVIKIFPARRMP